MTGVIGLPAHWEARLRTLDRLMSKMRTTRRGRFFLITSLAPPFVCIAALMMITIFAALAATTVYDLIALFRLADKNGWSFHSPILGDLVMRRRDAAGRWEYREPTKAEIEEFASIDAW